jgi:large subunit ribosomal protein L19e
MSDLSAQRRLAADVLDVGKNRVWFDPGAQGEIADAITRDEIRDLVDEGLIRAKDERGNSRGRARERQKKRAYGHRKGPGKRKGRAGARQDGKEQWQTQIRAQRRRLRELRDEGELSPGEYRDLYDKARGGEFRSVRYMMNYIENEYGDE